MPTERFAGWSRSGQDARLATTFVIIAALAVLAGAQDPPSTPARDLAHKAGLAGAIFSADYAVIQFKTVVLRNLSRPDTVFRIPVDLGGRYRAAIPAGTYNIELEATPDLLPFHRANVNARAGGESVVDLYPVPRGGTATTLHGDLALPGPKLDYEQFPVIGNLNLLIQYQTRISTKEAITYKGRHLLLTFDAVTIAGDSIKLDRATLVATVEHATRIDVGGKIRSSLISASPEVDLRAKERVLRITSANTREEQTF
jgi:hypothetical protein